MNVAHHEELSRGPRFGARHVQLFLLVGLTVLEANVRVILPYTLEAITGSNVTSDSNNTRPIKWDNNHTILSSFDWGYIILPILGGKLSTMYNSKRILTNTVLINSAVFILTPISAMFFGTAGIITVRVFQGLCAGLYSTVCYHILAHWTPPQEMSSTIGMLNSGYSLGYLITIAPIAKIYSSWAGWTATYYLSGCMGFLWLIPWIIFASNSPTEHKTITTQEKMYIQASLASREYPKQIPWKAILTSLPMSAIIISVMAKGCMDSLVLNEIRLHMSTIMKDPIEQTTLAWILPYFLRTIVIILGGYLSDWLVNKHFLSKTVARKIFNTVGTIIPAIALPFLTVCSVEKIYILNLLIVIVASATTYDGCMVNIMDISPTFCGTLRGIVSFVYTLFSLLLPLAAINVIKNIEEPGGWRILFTQVTCINIFAGMFYIFFASGKIQRWLPTSKIRVYGSVLWRADGKRVNESNL